MNDAFAQKYSFDLWLEFEEYGDPYPGKDDDPLCDFCNAQVKVGASTYAINIWTFAFVEIARRSDESGQPLERPTNYLLAPDLLVQRLDRETISSATQDLLDKGGLPATWRVQDDNETTQGSAWTSPKMNLPPDSA